MERMDRKKRKTGDLLDVSFSENQANTPWTLRRHRPLISDEIIFYEILSRLPLETLFECKLVCKQWHKFISTDSVFKASHCQRSVCHPSGHIYRGLHDKYIFLDPLLKCNTLAVTDLRSSSNGLLCGAYTRHGREYFYVTNPITKDRVSVPNLHKYKDVAFAFEPSSCNPYFAIVARYDASIEKMENGESMTTVSFGVYSSQTGTWSPANAKVKVFNKGFGGATLASQARTLYLGGSVYWKLLQQVFWFHIKDDTGGSVSVPDYKEIYIHGVLGDCNGELSYTKVSSENVVIWVLVSNDKTQHTWVQKYSVSFTQIFKDYYTNFKSACDDTVSELLDITTRPLMHLQGRCLLKAEMFSSGRGIKSAFNAFARPMPFEGGDVQFWARYGVHKKEGVVFSYNINTGDLQIIHNSQIQWSGPCFFSHRRSLAAVPK